MKSKINCLNAPSPLGKARCLAKLWLMFVLVVCLASPAQAQAADGGPSVDFIVGNLWLLVATAMVFVMHLGFASLEAGLTQEKNSINILFKNVCIIAIGFLTYAAIGFNLMYPGEEFAGGILSSISMLSADDNSVATVVAGDAYYSNLADFFFQVVFVATAMSIVSGAVAERMKLWSFFIFATILTGFIYPLQGFWKWGGGFLNEMGFLDFAGSGVVHMCGGSAALAERIEVAELFIFIVYLGHIYQPFLQLASINDVLQKAAVSTDRVFQLLAIESDIVDSDSARSPGQVDWVVDLRTVCTGRQSGVRAKRSRDRRPIPRSVPDLAYASPQRTPVRTPQCSKALQGANWPCTSGEGRRGLFGQAVRRLASETGGLAHPSSDPGGSGGREGSELASQCRLAQGRVNRTLRDSRLAIGIWGDIKGQA